MTRRLAEEDLHRNAEHRRICPDTQSEAADCGQGKDPVSPQCPGGVAEIGQQILQPADLPRRARLFPRVQAGPELTPRFCQCFGTGQARLLQFIRKSIDVKLDLVGKFPLESERRVR